MPAPIDIEIVEKARNLYQSGRYRTYGEIAIALGMKNPKVIEKWRKKYKWDETKSASVLEAEELKKKQEETKSRFTTSWEVAHTQIMRRLMRKVKDPDSGEQRLQEISALEIEALTRSLARCQEKMFEALGIATEHVEQNINIAYVPLQQQALDIIREVEMSKPVLIEHRNVIEGASREVDPDDPDDT